MLKILKFQIIYAIVAMEEAVLPTTADGSKPNNDSSRKQASRVTQKHGYTQIMDQIREKEELCSHTTCQTQPTSFIST